MISISKTEYSNLHRSQENLDSLSRDIPGEAVELPEGRKITYRGEEVTLRDGGFFNVHGARFRVTFARAAGGDLLQVVKEAPDVECEI